MKKLLILLFLLSLLFATSIKAEIVLYCKSDLIVGIIKDNESWRKGNFGLNRHTIKFSNNYDSLTGLSYNDMVCSYPYSLEPQMVVCVHSAGSHETFIFNKNSKRYTFSNVSVMGYSMNREDPDTEVLEVGTCEKF